jgi:hypothetical protein
MRCKKRVTPSKGQRRDGGAYADPSDLRHPSCRNRVAALRTAAVGVKDGARASCHQTSRENTAAKRAVNDSHPNQPSALFTPNARSSSKRAGASSVQATRHLVLDYQIAEVSK